MLKHESCRSTKTQNCCGFLARFPLNAQVIAPTLMMQVFASLRRLETGLYRGDFYSSCKEAVNGVYL